MNLPPGRFAVEWFEINSRKSNEAKQLHLDEEATAGFVSPLSDEPAVLYLRSDSGSTA